MGAGLRGGKGAAGWKEDRGIEREQRAEPPPATAQPRLGSTRPWGDRAKLVAPGEARPQPASRGGGAGTGGREDEAVRLPPLAARPPGELRPRSPSPSRSRSPLRTGKFAEGPGAPQGQRVPGCGGDSPKSPPLGSPRLVSGSQRLGRVLGVQGLDSLSTRSLRRGRGMELGALAQPELCLKQPFSMDFGDNLCFPAPVCGLGLGQGWHRGRGLRRLSEPPGPAVLREAPGGAGCGPIGGTLSARLRAQPAREACATQVCLLGTQPTDCSF